MIMNCFLRISMAGIILSFNDFAPCDPPVIYKSGRGDLYSDDTNNSFRIGSPVITDEGNCFCVSGNVTHTRRAIFAIIRFARPGTSVCSWVITGIPNIHPAIATGNATYPPKLTMQSGFSRKQYQHACKKPMGILRIGKKRIPFSFMSVCSTAEVLPKKTMSKSSVNSSITAIAGVTWPPQMNSFFFTAGPFC